MTLSEKATRLKIKKMNMDKTDIESLYELAHLYAETGQHKEAMIHFNSVIDIDPDFKNARFWKSKSYEKIIEKSWS